MENGYFSEKELLDLGIDFGKNVLISRNTRFYNPGDIKIGNNVRIDDFCTFSGKVELGNYIHISQFVSFYGGDAGIIMEDYTGISSKSTIYAVSDDYSGKSMVGPLFSFEYRPFYLRKQVKISKYSILGASSMILPGGFLAEGVAIGAMSLVNGTTEKWKIYGGIPAKVLKDRDRKLLEICREFEQSVFS
jgi:galactoside O-acetyltransferase